MDIFLQTMHPGDLALFFLRIVTGLIFIGHAFHKLPGTRAQKIAKALNKPKLTPYFMALGLAELLGGIALILGFLTPLAALGLFLIMLGATYLKAVRWGAPFAGKEKSGWDLNLLILAVTVLFVLIGPGIVSVDAWLFLALSS